MATGQFENLGIQDTSGTPRKYGALFTTHMLSGLLTNRNQLIDGTSPATYSHYGLSRNENLIGGLNSQLSWRKTLVRRPGHSVYNSGTFGPINSFVNFKPFGVNGSETILIIADGATDVREITGSNNNVLFTKSAGAGPTRTEQVGNRLFMSDTVDNKVWNWFAPWTATTTYSAGQSILDSSLNIQTSVGKAVLITSTQIATNVLTVNYTSPAGIIFTVGETVEFLGLTASSYLNGKTAVVATAGAGTFTASYTQSDYGPLADSGLATTGDDAVSGGSAPTFGSTVGAVTIDGQVGWICKGFSVQDAGITGPTVAPTVANVAAASNSAWAANTYFTPEEVITEAGFIYFLDTPGTTGGAPPVFGGASVADGSANWTRKTSATRATNHAYSVGDYYQATWIQSVETEVSTCFTGNVEIKTPSGLSRFDSFPVNRPFHIVNETGTHLAELVVHEHYDGPMISIDGDRLVTPTHLMKVGPDLWDTAEKKYPTNPRTHFKGNVYNLHVLSENEADHHYVLFNGDVAHNMKAESGTTTRVVTYTYSAYFRCTTAGTSNNTTTANISFPSGLFSSYTDGTAVFLNVGLPLSRANTGGSTSPSNSGTGTVAGTIGNSTLVTGINSIVSTNGWGQNCIIAGLSGGTEPTTGGFGTTPTVGQQTVETAGTRLTWQVSGPVSTANVYPWVYAFAYRRSYVADESNASPLSAQIVLQTDSWISVSGPGSPDLSVDEIAIYRSVQGFTTPFLLATIPAPLNGGNWSYVDAATPDPGSTSTVSGALVFTPSSVTGSILNTNIIAANYLVVNGVIQNANDPPPTGLTNLLYHAGRLWGSVGNTIYYSASAPTVGNAPTSWNVLNFFDVRSSVKRLYPQTSNLFIFTDDGVYSLVGLGTDSSPFQQPQRGSDNKLSISSYDGFVTDGTTPFLFTSDRSMVQLSPDVGIADVGLQYIGDILQTFDPATSGVAFYSNGPDRALYIHDFSTKFYRMAPAVAPETGWVWSPEAEIVGGMSAMNSVQDADGSYILLIGPKTSGPILKRDENVFTDNGSTYESYGDIGSIVLAKPGQIAGVVAISGDFIKTGSIPQVGVLFNEFSRQANTPPFQMMNNPTDEPYDLAPSQTRYKKRYWLNETGEPADCNDLQIRIDFGRDTVQNELCAFSVYGTLNNEV